jgi:hypothetical protein
MRFRLWFKIIIITAQARIIRMEIEPSTSVESQEVKTWNARVSFANNAYIGFLALTLIATVLIVVFNNRLNKAKDDQSLREKRVSDERIADANRQAGLANEGAARANERAGQADERAAKANERAAVLEKQNTELRTDLESATAESRKRQAELAKEQSTLATEQRKTAEAQREAATAQLALKTHLEKVARWQQDRQLTAPVPDRRKIDPAGIWYVTIGYKEGDDEAFRFAGRIFEALMAAGWSVTNDPHPIPVGETNGELGAPSIRPGITLFVPASAKWQSRASALAEAFKESGCPVRWAATRPDGQPGMWIVVGSKPAFSN